MLYWPRYANCAEKSRQGQCLLPDPQLVCCSSCVRLCLLCLFCDYVMACCVCAVSCWLVCFIAFALTASTVPSLACLLLTDIFTAKLECPLAAQLANITWPFGKVCTHAITVRPGARLDNFTWPICKVLPKGTGQAPWPRLFKPWLATAS